MNIQKLKQLHHNIITSIREFLLRKENENIDSLILGLSGGVDSALVAALVSQAIEGTDRKLYGYSLPIHTNKEDERHRASDVGEAFCDHYTMHQMTAAYLSFSGSILGSEISKSLREGRPLSVDQRIRAGNMKARMRMMFLYDKAREYNGMVLSTDNYTEYLLGFWTLHGDVGDFGPIQNLWKTEVYEVSQYLVECYFPGTLKAPALLNCINAVPTDGLGVTSSDMAQLLPNWEESVNKLNVDKSEGWQVYEIIDEILNGYVKGDPIIRSKFEDHPVIERMRATWFKRSNPYNIPRTDLL